MVFDALHWPISGNAGTWRQTRFQTDETWKLTKFEKKSNLGFFLKKLNFCDLHQILKMRRQRQPEHQSSRSLTRGEIGTSTPLSSMNRVNASTIMTRPNSPLFVRRAPQPSSISTGYIRGPGTPGYLNHRGPFPSRITPGGRNAISTPLSQVNRVFSSPMAPPNSPFSTDRTAPQTPSLFNGPFFHGSGLSRATMASPGYSNQRVPFTPILTQGLGNVGRPATASRLIESDRQVPTMPRSTPRELLSPWTPGSSLIVPQWPPVVVKKTQLVVNTSLDSQGDCVVPCMPTPRQSTLDLSKASSSAMGSSSASLQQPSIMAKPSKRQKRYLV